MGWHTHMYSSAMSTFSAYRSWCLISSPTRRTEIFGEIVNCRTEGENVLDNHGAWSQKIMKYTCTHAHRHTWVGICQRKTEANLIELSLSKTETI